MTASYALTLTVVVNSQVYSYVDSSLSLHHMQMAELVAAIQSALAGVDQAEVDTILEDTESILAMAMTVLQEAIRTE